MSARGRPPPDHRESMAIAGLEEFERCFEANFAVVHNFIARRVGLPLADDLAAETFATAFRRRHSFDPSLGPVRAWLLGIANNLVRAEWRAEQRVLGLVSRLEGGGASSGQEPGPEELVTTGLAPRVAKALAMLPPDQRDVLLLHAWGGLAHEEIAAALGLPDGTVRSRLSRARAALRSQLTGPGLGPGACEPLVGNSSNGYATKGTPAGGRHGR